MKTSKKLGFLLWHYVKTLTKIWKRRMKGGDKFLESIFDSKLEFKGARP